MNKIKPLNLWMNLINILVFLTFILFTFFIGSFINKHNVTKGYSFFIEFNNAYGIKKGTYVRMRGINIGHIKNIKMDINSILVLVYIDSKKILIPRNSIIETNQTGLLNDTVVDIIPLVKIGMDNVKNIDVLSSSCSLSSLICHLDYLEGDRGLNYDDLVRAATRISQRFDDPSFFSIFYLFLQNSVELSDYIMSIVADISNVSNLFYKVMFTFLDNS